MAGRRWMGAAAIAGAAALSGCADTGPPRPTAALPTPGRCSDERFPIYFTPGSAELRPEARAVINSGSNRVAGCRITAVDVVGMAAPDAAGRASDPALTQRRADAVAHALADAGLPAPAFDVQVAGAPPPRPGVRQPLARRTEVVLHAEPTT